MAKFKETTVGGTRYRFVRCKVCGSVFNAFSGSTKDGAIRYSCKNSDCDGYLMGEKALESISSDEAYDKLFGIYGESELAMEKIDISFGKKPFPIEKKSAV